MNSLQYIYQRKLKKHHYKKVDQYALTSRYKPIYDEDKSNYSNSDNINRLLNDIQSIILLLVLYTLQGIPIGLSGAVSMLMKDNGASYESLSLFSLVSLPFSLKLIWAPLVDSCYISFIGRRKTWLLPIQIISGLMLIYGSRNMTSWISDKPGSPDSLSITVYFGVLFFLMATQDISVDGWALNLLSRDNVGYASTCNAIGLTLGIFMSNQGLIALSDPVWCLNYFNQDKAFTTIPDFLFASGVVFIVITLLVMVFTKETENSDTEECFGLLDTYKQVISIFRLKPVQLLCMLLLTSKIAFAANEAAAMFKMQEYGMPKSHIATISPIFLILNLILPALTGKYFSSSPLSMMQFGLSLKVISCFLVWCLFQLVISEYANSAQPSISFFIVFITIMGINELSHNITVGAHMTYFAMISDPAIGGTYMTLLNTVTNLGSKWPNIMALYFLPLLTFSQCQDPSTGLLLPLENITSINDCSLHKDMCSTSGGKCVTTCDGYTVMSFVCLFAGLVWMFATRRALRQLACFKATDWLTNLKKS